MHTLYTRGLKDGRLRRVEHIPVDMSTRQTAVSGTACCLMRQLCDDGAWRVRPINRNRVESIEEDRYGHPHATTLGQLARA